MPQPGQRVRVIVEDRIFGQITYEGRYVGEVQIDGQAHVHILDDNIDPADSATENPFYIPRETPRTTVLRIDLAE